MCGRYSMYESMDHYLRQLSLDLVVINGYDHASISRYNVAPSTRVEVIRQIEARSAWIGSSGDGRHSGQREKGPTRSMLGRKRW